MRKEAARLEGRRVLITGASSGIGEATAFALAGAGAMLILVARNRERLARVAQACREMGVKAEVWPYDLAQPEARTALLERVHNVETSIDVLINNAGLAWYGYAEAIEPELARKLIAVNLQAVVELTLGVLPMMKARRHGHIIQVGSIVGSLPSQGVALYGATKAFVDAFSSALTRELVGSGVSMTVIRAGAVATPFYEAAAARPHSLPIPVGWMAISPERVADRILYAVRRPRPVVYVPGYLRAVPWVERIFGGPIDRLGPLLLRWQTRSHGGHPIA